MGDLLKAKATSLKHSAKFGLILTVTSYLMLALAMFTLLLTGIFASIGLHGYNVVSNSMVPLFSKGDLVVLSTEANSYGVGDIVIYQQHFPMDRLVVHRIINVSGSQIAVKGDANSVPDVPFDKSQIKGEVVAIAPKMGYVFTSKVQIGLSIAGIVLSMLGSYVTSNIPRGRHAKIEVSRTPKIKLPTRQQRGKHYAKHGKSRKSSGGDSGGSWEQLPAPTTRREAREQRNLRARHQKNKRRN